MSNESRKAKIYGAIETETYMLFTGFCKKIYSAEKQEVSVFIDDIKTDILIANENIKEIQEKYEVYDTEGFCFRYEIPLKYVGEKHKLEFKTIDNQQLLNSPTFTVDKNNPNYSLYSFIRSLVNISTQNLEWSLHSKKSIGFLANNENIEDKKHLEIIKNTVNHFKQEKIKLFYFTKNEEEIISNIFKNNQNVEPCKIEKIEDILKEIEIYLCNINNKIDFKIHKILEKYSKEIYSKYTLLALPNIKNLTLSELDSMWKNKNSAGNYHKNFYTPIFKRNNINYKINLQTKVYEFYNQTLLELLLENSTLKNDLIKLNRGEFL